MFVSHSQVYVCACPGNLLCRLSLLHSQKRSQFMSEEHRDCGMSQGGGSVTPPHDGWPFLFSSTLGASARGSSVSTLFAVFSGSEFPGGRPDARVSEKPNRAVLSLETDAGRQSKIPGTFLTRGKEAAK